MITLYYVTNLDDPTEGTLVANEILARDAIISEIRLEAVMNGDDTIEEIKNDSSRWIKYESPDEHVISRLEGCWVLKDEEFWYYYEVKVAESLDEYAEMSPDMR
jgi:hypothetical protein